MEQLAPVLLNYAVVGAGACLVVALGRRAYGANTSMMSSSGRNRGGLIVVIALAVGFAADALSITIEYGPVIHWKMIAFTFWTAPLTLPLGVVMHFVDAGWLEHSDSAPYAVFVWPVIYWASFVTLMVVARMADNVRAFYWPALLLFIAATRWIDAAWAVAGI